MTKETIGFIGLGSQGGPMARRIVDAGFALHLWARRPESLVGFADTAARVEPSIAALGAACSHVGICVVDDAGVREICSALIPAMTHGSRIVLHSTIHPDTCKDLARQAAAGGIALLDAPVSGGGHAAAAGTLTVMVGGEAAVVARARAVLDTFASQIMHMGDVGTGQMAKLVNNALMAAHMALAHHALATGESLNIDRKALAELVLISSGRSYSFEVCAQLPNLQAFSHGGRLLLKDVGLLSQLLPDSVDCAALRDVATPFLKLTMA
jgi:3-hydroxyisobutyrate dehydrogenase